MKTILFLVAFTTLLFGCATKTEESPEQMTTTSTIESPPIAVKVMPVAYGSFPLKTTTNGRLQAARKLALKLDIGGKIEALYLKEGHRVQKGDLLLRLEDTTKQLQLEQYQLALEEAEVNKADLLIANGGKAYVDTSVSAQKLQLINTLSGYNKAKHAIKQAEYELSKSKVFAPFTALIADVKVQAQQQVGAGEAIATLIDPNSFEAVFTLLEKDALQVKAGERVRLQALANPAIEMNAKISTINPVVNEQGLVTVYAQLSRTNAQLFEGMNVQVSIERPVARQLIVPRSAVVLRSDRTVVFTYENGFAKWNYVSIAHENDRSVAIAEGLSAQDTIIYEGNLNLDHDGEVILEKKEDQ
ncbi:MAG: efflux RND transporter periplasmic adaptor subunit [Bacteroidota bacterium]